MSCPVFCPIVKTDLPWFTWITNFFERAPTVERRRERWKGKERHRAWWRDVTQVENDYGGF
jgi:hypothetical protein